MRDRSRDEAIEVLRRQMRAVRRRWNLLALQRVLYLLIATAATGAAFVVLLALRARASVFVVASWSIAGGVLAAASWVVRDGARRWLPTARAPAWIDARAGLRGRVATLAELGAGARTFFGPLLVEQNARRAEDWRPHRLLPDAVPLAPLLAALLATSVFFALLVFAPRLAPAPAAIVVSDAPVGPLAAVDADDVEPARVVVARAAAEERTDSDPARLGREGESVEGEPVLEHVASRLPRSLRDRIRDRLWGPAARATGTAVEMDRSRRDRSTARPSGTRARDSDDDARWQVARRPPPPDATTARAGGPGARGDGSPRGDDPSRSGSGTGNGGSGAGTATDPNLFGAASAAENGHATFDLPLAARVHALGSGPRPPSGDAPPAAPDAAPALAARPRRDAPVLRMTVPAAYEGLVRQVFAHHGTESP